MSRNSVPEEPSSIWPAAHSLRPAAQKRDITIAIFAVCISIILLMLSSTTTVPAVGEVAQSKKSDPAPDTPSVTLPTTKTAKPNRYFCIKAGGNCTSIKWIVPSGLDTIDPEIVLKDKNSIVLIGDTGTYTVQAYGALNGQASDIASCAVTIGTPTPPTPPTPSALLTALQTAFSQDTDATKAADVQTLASLYGTAATSTVNETSLATLGDLFSVMASASQKALVAAALPNTRAAIGVYLTAQLGTTSTQPLDATTRSKASMAFVNISKALKEVK